MATRLLRAGVRIARALGLAGFGMAAISLADGSASLGGTALGTASVGSTLLRMATPALGNEIEAALVRGIVGLREQGLRQSMGEIDRALERHPNFRLAHLVKGDLLMARAGKPVAFASAAATPEVVAHLQDEARVRLQRYLDAPPVETLPAPLLQLAPSQPHALLVDTRRSRLFVYANDRGRPRYVTDFYISLGKNGIDKEREGDQKTPIGVYTIVSAKERLPDFYGPGAYPISYPNEWDRRHKRNGHGIWLHGTPSETYARPPRATDGCIVLTNDDLTRLTKYVDVSRTPVVIGEAVEWREAGQWRRDRDAFLAAFERWRADWESLDAERYLSHYAADFRSESHDLASWKAAKQRAHAGKRWVKVGVDDLSLFAYPGAADMMVVTFRQDYRSSNLSNRATKRQYWRREAGHWRIVHEAVVS